MAMLCAVVGTAAVQQGIDLLADDMTDEDVGFLDARGLRRSGGAENDIRLLRQPAPFAAGEADGGNAEAPAGRDGAQDTRRHAAGGNGNCDIASLSERFDLLSEDTFVAV